jgi:peptidoglycan/LPS O-acetylase OafA/YrhL
MIIWFALCLVAVFTKNRTFHASFAIIFMVWNLAFAGMILITAQDALGAKLFRTQ